jgi:hypothetical protein
MDALPNTLSMAINHSSIPPNILHANDINTNNHQAIPSPPVLQLSRGSSKSPLPPTHVLLAAADIYFRYCYNQPYSLFHEARFRQRLAAGQVKDFLVWAFLAASRRFSTLPHHDFEGGDTVSNLARKAAAAFVVPWSGPANADEALSVLQYTALMVTVEHTGECCWANSFDDSLIRYSWAMRFCISQTWICHSRGPALRLPNGTRSSFGRSLSRRTKKSILGNLRPRQVDYFV